MSDRPKIPRVASLCARIERTTQHALASGALRPIETSITQIQDRGIQFAIRMTANLRRKPEARMPGSPTNDTSSTATPHSTSNPFLPYDRELYVTDVGERHVCLLNKFNVLEHHLLLVTRRYESQEEVLNPSDFRALWACMDQLDWLAFYNGGRTAGASQRHKHLQLVPPRLGGPGQDIPVESVLPLEPGRTQPHSVSALAFEHYFHTLDGRLEGLAAADAAYQSYVQGLDQCEIRGYRRRKSARQACPYNLLLTRRWILLVPRTIECYESMSVNALAFAGALLARTPEETEIIRAVGPMHVLTAVALRRDKRFAN